MRKLFTSILTLFISTQLFSIDSKHKEVGKLVIPAVYDNAYDFKEGFATVMVL